MKYLLPLLLALTLLIPCAARSDAAAAQRIKITVGETVLTATMNDNPTARDFISLLPLTMSFRDFAGVGKISTPPRKLSTRGTPGCSPRAGDITLYIPWGNLAVFYRDGRTANDANLIPLGRFDSGIELLAAINGDFTARIELTQ